jgi:type 1 glutamine amidotransferase
MKKIRLILVSTTLLVSTLAFSQSPESKVKPDMLEKVKAALPSGPAVKPRKAHEVLVFSKTAGFRHSSIEVGVATMKLLGGKTGVFTVTATEDEASFEPDSLAKFDAIIFLNTTGDVFRPRQWPTEPEAQKAALEREERLKKSLVDFVKGGKGLVGMHSATDTCKAWKEYNDMMGGAFDGHPWHEQVAVKNLVPDHPVNKAFGGRNLEITDEIYQFRADTASKKDRRMLLALDPAGTKTEKGKQGKDGFYPVSWMRKYGEGRTFYCSLGHREEIYWNPVVLQHYLAGIQYALGDLDADASPTEAP